MAALAFYVAAWVAGAAAKGSVALGSGKYRDVDYADGEHGERPPRPVVRRTPDGLSVHVAVSSYRDQRCGVTLYELFSQAKRPELVTVGVVEQYLPGDVRCVERYCEMIREAKGLVAGDRCPYEEQVRVKELRATDVHGPAHARSYAHEVRGREEFCLQIDSHTVATTHWDEKLLREWEKAENEYAVLSTYLQSKDDMASREDGSNINNRREIPVMCSTISGRHAMVRNHQAYAAWELERPLRSCYWGAGLSFSKCHMEDRVPRDPDCAGVFDGEEFLQALRMWTHGYDTYAPSRSILFHDYSHQQDPKKWHGAGGDAKVTLASYNRMKYIVGLPGALPVDVGPYGLGRARNKTRYEQMCHLNLPAGPVSDSSPCGAVPWVPFTEADLAQLPFRATTVSSAGTGQRPERLSHPDPAADAWMAGGVVVYTQVPVVAIVVAFFALRRVKRYGV
eukprot:TRINITY_DN18573_c0_g1_i1.p1 TRINITY_DN18573_c0_g1~~TRINITY_DN18573_c0_g1_i1.p1  ORF type:complete len:451 (+),score=102.13 TRINITY_DN18573_c0_g1_i1:27-1379(+)